MQGTFGFKIPGCFNERFGSAFFRAIPKSPGVYLMRDSQQRVVYVGKAKNLRARLNSYRCIDGARSRKTARLVATVRQIAWEVSASEEEALLRENMLLRDLRPRFNRLNTFPQRHAFIALERQNGTTCLRVTRDAGLAAHGAFKGPVREALHALARVSWTAFHACSYADLPRVLVAGSRASSVEFVCGQEANDALHAFFLGSANAFSEWPDTETTLFFRTFRATDRAVIEQFFNVGPRRNRLLRELFNVSKALIEPAELDDLIVRARCRASAERSVSVPIVA